MHPIVGIDITERQISLAVQTNENCQLLRLKYDADLNFNDSMQVGKRMMDVKQTLKSHFSFPPNCIVISIPMYLVPENWQRITQCAQLIGLDILRMTTQLAASAYYIASLDTTQEQSLVVFNKKHQSVSTGIFSLADGVCESLWMTSDKSLKPIKQMIKVTKFEFQVCQVLSLSKKKNKEFYKKHIQPSLPKRQRKKLTFSHIPNSPALGALLISGTLTGDIKDLLLLDLLSHSFGILVSEESEILSCYECTQVFSKNDDLVCPHCGGELKKEPSGAIFQTKKQESPSHRLILADAQTTIPTRKSQIVFVENPHTLISLVTLDSQGTILATKRIKPTKFGTNQKRGYFEFTLDVDAARHMQLSIKELSDRSICYKTFTPKISLSKAEQKQILGKKQRPQDQPDITIKKHPMLFQHYQSNYSPSRPLKKPKPIIQSGEDISLDECLDAFFEELGGDHDEYSTKPSFKKTDFPKNNGRDDFESFDNLDDLDWSDVEDELHKNRREILQEAEMKSKKSKYPQ